MMVKRKQGDQMYMTWMELKARRPNVLDMEGAESKVRLAKEELGTPGAVKLIVLN